MTKILVIPFVAIVWCMSGNSSPALTSAQPVTPPPLVLEMHQLRFHSDFWMNFHHWLYASVWARRSEAGAVRALAEPLPVMPGTDVTLSPAEQKAWGEALDYYDRRIASRDLLFDDGMEEIKEALAAAELSSAAVGVELRTVLEAAAPVYRRHYWPDHDRRNREWIATTTARARTIAPRTIARLEKLYARSWFTSPVRIDIVMVGTSQGAYTSTRPPHAVISSSNPRHTEWTAVEIVFHEISHVLVSNVSAAISGALGQRRREHGQLWHVVQFYLTGAAVQDVLRGQGIDYTPYLYSTGLFDRAWGRYRKAVEDNWKPYVDGAITLDQAIARTIAAL